MNKTLQTLIDTKIGEASMCWEHPQVAGIFDSDHAKHIATSLYAAIEPALGLAAAEAQVKDFMQKAGQATPERPTVPSDDVRILRVKLIAEELCELCDAYDIDLKIDFTTSKKPEITVTLEHDRYRHGVSLVEAYDAYLDLMVVVLGGAIAQGTKVQPGWEEVHSSNMSKFIDGHRREDGKWMKGPSYRPANLRPIIDVQSSVADACATD